MLYNNVVFQTGAPSNETRCVYHSHSSLQLSESAGDLVKDCDLQVHGLLRRAEDEKYRRS